MSCSIGGDGGAKALIILSYNAKCYCKCKRVVCNSSDCLPRDLLREGKEFPGIYPCFSLVIAAPRSWEIAGGGIIHKESLQQGVILCTPCTLFNANRTCGTIEFTNIVFFYQRAGTHNMLGTGHARLGAPSVKYDIVGSIG